MYNFNCILSTVNLANFWRTANFQKYDHTRTVPVLLTVLFRNETKVIVICSKPDSEMSRVRVRVRFAYGRVTAKKKFAKSSQDSLYS